MKPTEIEPLKLRTNVEHWPLWAPFRIAGHMSHCSDVVVVGLTRDGQLGRGEATGVCYQNDTPTSLASQIEAVRTTIESGLNRQSLQEVLPAGGARNALDCALWDLEAKRTGRAASQPAEFEKPRPLLTTFTCSADEPERMTAIAREYPNARAIKLKLTGEPIDAERVRALRHTRPDLWHSVDGNRGFTRASLEQLMPVPVDANVAIIQKPFPVRQEGQLNGLESVIPIATDKAYSAF